jgi:manganese/zinc/iron transport system permease protein
LFERESVNAAGSMALVAGGFVAIAVVASPRHGVIMRAVRRRTLARSVARDDLLATLYRADERGRSSLHVDSIRSTMAERPIDAVVRRAARRGLIVRDQEIVRLTARGRDAARELVRKHRLWEHYLVDRVGLSPDHVHATAEVLEHVAIRPRTGPSIDPHGRQIPDQAEEKRE